MERLNEIRTKRNKYLIEVVRIGKLQHTHSSTRTNDLFTTIKEKTSGGAELEIKVEPKDLYEVSSNPFSYIKSRILYGQKKHYLMVVNPKGSPVTESKRAISGKVLRVARDWKGLGKAVGDSFGTRLEIPRLALIAAVVIGLGVIIFLVSQGYIPLPRSWTQ